MSLLQGKEDDLFSLIKHSVSFAQCYNTGLICQNDLIAYHIHTIIGHRDVE